MSSNPCLWIEVEHSLVSGSCNWMYFIVRAWPKGNVNRPSLDDLLQEGIAAQLLTFEERARAYVISP